MKQIAKWIILLAVLCAVGWGAYSAGYTRGHDRALIHECGTFVGAFDALQKIRAGDFAGGTRRVETMCFKAANIVYQDRPGSEVVAKIMLESFRRYRQTYRTNSAEWSWTEQDLEKKLAAR